MNRTRMDEEKMGSEARWNTVRRELKDRSSRVHVTSLPPYAPLSSSLRSAWSSFPRSLLSLPSLRYDLDENGRKNDDQTRNERSVRRD